MNGDDPKPDEFPIRVGEVGRGEQPRVYRVEGGVVVNDENGLALHTDNGTVATIRTDGTREVHNPVVSRIEIEDSRRVQRLQVNVVFDTVSHTVEFAGGGYFSYVMDARGEVLEMVWRHVQMSHDEAGVVRIRGASSMLSPGESTDA